VQCALQGLHRVACSRPGAPAAQLLAGLREEFGRFVENIGST
jgi:hypothetical protein